MRLGLKTKQVAGVTSIVGLAVVVLSLLHLTALARIRLEESRARGELLSNALFQRAREVVEGAGDPYEAIRTDPGIRSILQSITGYSRNVTYAAIVDSNGLTIAHGFETEEGRVLPPQEDLNPLLLRGPIAQLRAVYSTRTFELRQALLLGTEEFGSIRIGVSTLLIERDLHEALTPAAITAAAALVVSVIVSMLLAQWLLRPIHVIKSGLSRLGRGEFDVTVDLPPGEEFDELGRSFASVSARLATVHTQAHEAATAMGAESTVDRLEDAVALIGADGELLFANEPMRSLLPAEASGPIDDILPAGHPYRQLVGRTLATRQTHGPSSQLVPPADDSREPTERLLACYPVSDTEERFVGVVLVARNLSYLTAVQSSLRYSRKLVALGRLLAGVAHEVKNPLNAMTIHLELLRQKLDPGRRSQPRAPAPPEPPTVPVDTQAAMRHVTIIGDEIRRLDEVVQGFLKFARPDELALQPIEPAALVDGVVEIVQPQAASRQIAIRREVDQALPRITGDLSMLRQALLNLALNACEAMPNGGTLRLGCRNGRNGHVEIEVEDTGVGIAPEHLEHVFDLYFTTKERGSGIGLSMVYRIVQLHDGDIEVSSVPGRGTSFRVTLRTA